MRSSKEFARLDGAADLAALRQSIAAAEGQLYVKEKALLLVEKKLELQERELELKSRKEAMRRPQTESSWSTPSETKPKHSEELFRVAVLHFNKAGLFLKHGDGSKALELAHQSVRILQQEAPKSAAAASLLPSATRMVHLAGAAARGADMISAAVAADAVSAGETDASNDSCVALLPSRSDLVSSASTMRQEGGADANSSSTPNPSRELALERLQDKTLISDLEEEVRGLRQLLAEETAKYSPLIDFDLIDAAYEKGHTERFDCQRRDSEEFEEKERGTIKDPEPRRESWADMVQGDLSVKEHAEYEGKGTGEPHDVVLPPYSAQPVVLPHQKVRQARPASGSASRAVSAAAVQRAADVIDDDMLCQPVPPGVAFRVRVGDRFEPNELCAVKRSDATWRYGRIKRCLTGDIYCVAVTADSEKVGVPGDNLGKLDHTAIGAGVQQWEAAATAASGRSSGNRAEASGGGNWSLGMCVSDEAPAAASPSRSKELEVFVCQLVPGGPAHLAGIMVGDQLLGIDDVPVSRVSFQQGVCWSRLPLLCFARVRPCLRQLPALLTIAGPFPESNRGNL